MGNRNLTSINPDERNSSLDDIVIIRLTESTDIPSKCEYYQMTHSIRTFFYQNQCEEYLQQNNKQKVFLIVSDKFGEKFISHIHDLSTIDSIYLICQDKNRNKLWSNKYSKLNENIFSKTCELYNKLKQDIKNYQNDSIKIDITNDQLNKLEPDFMYSQLLKETLINIEYDQNSKKEFFNYFNQQSKNQIDILKEFENNYKNHTAIWWYTRECFLYEVLNKALRTENIDLLIKMGFFIRDLHQQIQTLYSTQEHNEMIVYRGQGMTNNQFEKLCECKGGLISFQNFLSTTLEKPISLEFARRASSKLDLRGIIFRMEINPKLINLSNPYASLDGLSYFEKNEKEILFSTHTVFRIESIRKIKGENKIWQVDLKLTTNQNDIKLQQLTKYLREELQSSTNPWESLAKLLLKKGQFDKAQQIYENILDKISPNDNEQLAYIYHQLGYVHNDKQNFDKALEYFQKSIYIKTNYLLQESNDPQLADTYLNIGSIYHIQKNIDKALLYFDYTLKTNTNDPNILASIYNNIGTVCKTKGEFLNALEYFEKTLEIDSKYLPSTHPNIATTYYNIGRVYFLAKDYLNASIYFKKTLDIRRSSLPQNHPLLLSAIINYQNTEILLTKHYSQSNLSTSIQYKRSISTHSNRFSRQISNLIKRKS